MKKYPKGRLPLWKLLVCLGACKEATIWSIPYGKDYERAWLECTNESWMYWFMDWLVLSANEDYAPCSEFLTARKCLGNKTWNLNCHAKQLVKEHAPRLRGVTSEHLQRFIFSYLTYDFVPVKNLLSDLKAFAQK